QPAHLTVIKQVTNDNGGTKLPQYFQITVTGNAPNPASFPGSLAGTDVTLGAGAFSVDEAPVTGYTKTGAVGCSGTLALGDTKTCTITNDDQPAHLPVITTVIHANDDQPAQLTVKKHVINDNGGANLPGDFAMTVTSNGVPLPSFPGSDTGTVVTLSAGPFNVAESTIPGYVATAAGCAGTLALGQA